MTAGDEQYVREALKQAAEAAERGEVPVGAVIVRDGRIIGRAHNQMEQLKDPTAHAEMIAITQACEAVGDWRLEGAELFATVEPCPMCAGAAVLARVSRIVYGADDPIAGACGSVFNVVSEPKLNHRIPVVKGVLAKECGAIVRDFFRARRKKQD
jgi:tRNA(adenine34) deaminase